MLTKNFSVEYSNTRVTSFCKVSLGSCNRTLVEFQSLVSTYISSKECMKRFLDYFGIKNPRNKRMVSSVTAEPLTSRIYFPGASVKFDDVVNLTDITLLLLLFCLTDHQGHFKETLNHTKAPRSIV